MTRSASVIPLAAYALMAAVPVQASQAMPHPCHEKGPATHEATHEAATPEPPATHHHGHGAAEASPAEQPADWSASGRYLDACRCNAPCPCHFGVRADYDTCDPTLVYHITQGHFQGVQLDGLTTVVVASRGMARLYIDERAEPAQRSGLEAIARHMTATLLRGGFKLAADQAVTSQPMQVVLTDERAEVTIPGILEIAADRLVGGDGTGRIVLGNMNLGPSWMEEAWAGRAETYRYQDAAAWEYSGRNAYFGRFRVSAPAAPADSDAPGR